MGEFEFYVPALNELEQIPKPKDKKGGWGYCGIAAISAAIRISPLKVYKAIPDWPGYTPSRMVISTLEGFGYKCTRKIVAKEHQRTWPRVVSSSKSTYTTALGRIYFGEGKFVDSHWLCFGWEPGNPHPVLYDSALRIEKYWLDTALFGFYDEPARLKSLYFVSEKC